MSEQLRALALAATPGPWITKDWASTDSDGAINVCGTSVMAPQALCGIFTVALEGDGTEDIDFIAAANPAAILALLDEMAELRADANDCGSGAGCCYQAAQNERLEAELQQAREERTALLVNEQNLCEELAALRAVPAIPEGWKLVPVEPTQEMLYAYVAQNGRFHSARSDWAAMLAAAPQQKDRPDFIAGYDAGMADAKRIAERERAEAPVAQSLNALAKRRIYDAIREAYDIGYSDARNAGARSGDSAPGYKGRDIEEDHGGALLSAINAQLAAAPQQAPQADHPEDVLGMVQAPQPTQP